MRNLLMIVALCGMSLFGATIKPDMAISDNGVAVTDDGDGVILLQNRANKDIAGIVLRFTDSDGTFHVKIFSGGGSVLLVAGQEAFLGAGGITMNREQRRDIVRFSQSAKGHDAEFVQIDLIVFMDESGIGADPGGYLAAFLGQESARKKISAITEVDKLQRIVAEQNQLSVSKDAVQTRETWETFWLRVYAKKVLEKKSALGGKNNVR